MTRRESDALAVIVAFRSCRGYYPTVRELAKAMRLRSTSDVFRMMRGLQSKGLVSWDPRASRTLVVKGLQE